MKKYLSLTVVFLLLFAACKSDDSNPSTDDDGGTPLPANATYQITFTPNFTSEDFPTDYPANPQFQGMLIAVHDNTNKVFSTGSLASAGMKDLAETGSNGLLAIELSEVTSQDEVNFNVQSSASSGGPTSPQTLTIVIEPEKTRLSFVASLSPSPDWFVGFDSYNLVTADNALVDDMQITLSVFDAGTDSGTTYEAIDNPTSPAQSIAAIAGPPFSSGGLAPTIGTVRIQRID